MATLFNITAEQKRINEALMELDGELTPELEEALVINAENFAVKVEGYATSIHQFEAYAEAADAEIKRLTALKKSAQGAAKRLKGDRKDVINKARVLESLKSIREQLTEIRKEL